MAFLIYFYIVLIFTFSNFSTLKLYMFIYCFNWYISVDVILVANVNIYIISILFYSSIISQLSFYHEDNIKCWYGNK